MKIKRSVWLSERGWVGVKNPKSVWKKVEVKAAVGKRGGCLEGGVGS